MNAVADSKTYYNNRLKAGLDPNNMPKHIAVIMDGNGRWAKSKGKPRVFCHKKGVNSVRKTVAAASKLGIKAIQPKLVKRTALVLISST